MSQVMPYDLLDDPGRAYDLLGHDYHCDDPVGPCTCRPGGLRTGRCTCATCYSAGYGPANMYVTPPQPLPVRPRDRDLRLVYLEDCTGHERAIAASVSADMAKLQRPDTNRRDPLKILVGIAALAALLTVILVACLYPAYYEADESKRSIEVQAEVLSDPEGPIKEEIRVYLGGRPTAENYEEIEAAIVVARNKAYKAARP